MNRTRPISILPGLVDRLVLPASSAPAKGPSPCFRFALACWRLTRRHASGIEGVAFLGFVFVVVLLPGCSRPVGGAMEASHTGAEDAMPGVAVSSPYLAAVASDLLGDTYPLVVLSKPGMCPGHFDLPPSLVRRVRTSQLLVRFVFQQSLDGRLADSGGTPPKCIAVDLPGGMCEPDSYAVACRQMASAFVTEGLLTSEEANARLTAIQCRMDALSAWAAEQIAAAGLEQAAVLAAGHQAAFCRGLGLNVVATFSAADTALPSQINQAVQQGREANVRIILANLPEGRQLADALADRIGARVVVFGNIPDSDGPDSGAPEAFDHLVRGNVAALVKAAGP